jgi:transcriptional regulator with XRE-family HTH domain
MKKQMLGVDSAEVRAIFGRNFHQARLKLRLRQRDIHLITGIAQSHVSEIEKGTCNLAVDTMVKLAHVVKTPLWRLFKPSEAGNADEIDLDEVDPRRAPRSKCWHDTKVQQLVFDFTDEEMRRLRSAAAASGLQVMDYIRRVLDEQGWKVVRQQPSPLRRTKTNVD